MEKDFNMLHERIAEMMLRLSFEILWINGQPIFHKGNKYIRISCGNKYTVVEIATGLVEAQNNLYEDLDLYDYEYMKNNFGDSDLVKTIENDIVQYVINKID